MGIDKFFSVTELDKKKTGAVEANGARIKNAGVPKDPGDLTTKSYVDELFDEANNRVAFIANDKAFSIKTKKDNSESIVSVSTNNVLVQAAAAASESNANGASCHLSAGHGDQEGNGGDINLVPGVGGKGGESGKINLYGSVNVDGVLQFSACDDPGEPPHNVVYLWLDKNDKLLKARKKDVEDLILI